MPHRIAVLAGLALVATLAGPVAAQHQISKTRSPEWAPVQQATITPGVQVAIEDQQCTANFVFFDDLDLYLGMAAHCAGLGGPTDTDGCAATSVPLGTDVAINGASRPGSLAYSSWLTMADVGETDRDPCAFNDFALVRIHLDDHDAVNPSVPVFGGPDGLNDHGTTAGEQVVSYGNSSLRAGLEPLAPKYGFSLGSTGWSHDVYTVTPGIPGDSGSGFLDSDGNAFGVLATLAIAPLPASNGVTDLRLALDYLHDHTALSVELAPGTEPFAGAPPRLGTASG